MSIFFLLSQEDAPPLGVGYYLKHETVFYALIALLIALCIAKAFTFRIFHDYACEYGIYDCHIGQVFWAVPSAVPLQLSFSLES